MTAFELSTLIIACASFITSCVAANIAVQSNKTNKEIAKRQGVIDLHVQWSQVSDIDMSDPVVPDIHGAINALNLTASLWNHDVMLKPIILQSYWDSYRDLYDKFYSHNELIEPLKRTGKSMITNDITKAYNDMKNASLSNVYTTKY